MIENLHIFNEIYKESEKIYRDAARLFGLSDCAFWIIYTLRDSRQPVTQSDIRSIIHHPPQTINSALKKLEADGCVVLANLSDRRSKQILLTEKGEALSAKTADRMIAMETAAMESLKPEEQTAMLLLLRKYTDALSCSVQALASED